jgi:hypothetical protein
MRQNAAQKEKTMKRNMYALVVLFIFVCIFGFAGCYIGQNKGFYFDEKTFASEWDAWKNNNILNYSFTMTGELPSWNFSRAILMEKYEVTIVVKNGVMDSFEYEGDAPKTEDGASILEPEFTSISDMYEKIHDRAEYEKEWWKEYTGGGIISTRFEVKYNTKSHYITYFEPVSEWESGWIVDSAAHAVTISNFTVLNNDD